MEIVAYDDYQRATTSLLRGIHVNKRLDEFKVEPTGSADTLRTSTSSRSPSAQTCSTKAIGIPTAAFTSLTFTSNVGLPFAEHVNKIIMFYGCYYNHTAKNENRNTLLYNTLFYNILLYNTLLYLCLIS